eukprot:580633-Amphidinium_carterae.3
MLLSSTSHARSFMYSSLLLLLVAHAVLQEASQVAIDRIMQADAEHAWQALLSYLHVEGVLDEHDIQAKTAIAHSHYF